MRAFTRIITAGLFVSAAVLTAVPASAATPPNWCKGPSPCTVVSSTAPASAATPDWCSDAPSGAPCTIAPADRAAQAATPDGWCLIPGTDICRRY